MVSYPWRPITDLPSDWDWMARPDLDEMLRLWNEERQHLADPDRARQLEERLATLWSIETGVIERLYSIDRGTTASLVELGLGAIERFSTTGRLTEKAASLIEDQRAALEFVFAYIKDDRPLTLSYVRELHQLLMRNQTHVDAVDQFGSRFQAQAQRGVWKARPNNPTTVDGSVHEYAPPDFVQDEMDTLIKLHQQHRERGVRPEVEAAWLHHRFTQIHPFQDGNGRVARALATMIFLKAEFVPLVVRDDDHRERYLDALALADAGDLKPLVDLFANIVSADLNDAITFVRTMHGRTIKEIAAAAATAEASRRRAPADSWDLRTLTQRYMQSCYTRLTDVAFELDAGFFQVSSSLGAERHSEVASTASTAVPGPVSENRSRTTWWWRQLYQVTDAYKYQIDVSRDYEWVQLTLPDSGLARSRWYIIVSFHHKASRADVMAAVLFLTSSNGSHSPSTGDGAPAIAGSATEFTYSGSYPQDERFQLWVEAALTNALEAWQARI